MNKFEKKFYTSIREKDTEPGPDLVTCTECNKTFKISECPQETDGDYESGYYQVSVCPICEDGGCCDQYDFSEVQWEKWEKWNKSKQ